MKARRVFLMAMALTGLSIFLATAQTVPQLINYQGRLTNASGIPLDGVSVDLTFTFYSADTVGTTYLTVLQSNVAVNKGIYNVLIGSGTITPGTESTLAAVFQKHTDVWMGVKVGSDNEMTPRSRVGSVPYALAVAESHTGAVYRWNTFHSYWDGGAWFFNNTTDMTGGVSPQNWTDGVKLASDMTSNKDILRTLFSQKGYGGKNALVWASEECFFSSTDGRMVTALFRIRNTTGSAINWPVSFYCTSESGGYYEKASIAVNGVSAWTSTFCNMSGDSATLSIPANRISTVIFVSASGSGYTVSGTLLKMRPSILGFYNNSLALPAGLEYVDDFDTAAGGWEQ